MKKMNVAEFEQWSRFASELRDKTIDGLIDFEQYYADIRKCLFFIYSGADLAELLVEI